MTTSVALTTAQDQVDRARTAFQGLPRDNTLFQQCFTDELTLENVFAHLRKKSIAHKRKLSTKTLDRFQRCTGWMLNISRSVDIAVNASAGIACPIWAPIKFVLMISKDDATALEEVIDMIEHISDNLPRLDLYERFRDEPSFQTTLVNLFADMAEFATQVHLYFSRRTLARLGSLVRRNFKDHFGRTILAIERRTKIVDSSAIALHQARTEQLLQEAKAKSRMDDRFRIMRWLNPPEIQDVHERAFSMAVDSTCEWLLDHPAFSTWIGQQNKATESRILVVHGGPGSGKSVLSAFAYHVLRQRPDGYADRFNSLKVLPTDFATFYFSFSMGDLTRQLLAAMIRSILSQLLEYDRTESSVKIIEEITMKSSISTTELQNSLSKACLALSEPVFLVIDGIDEHKGPVDELLQKLVQLVYAVPNINLILFGQSHAFAKFLVSSSNIASITVVPELTYRDMEAVIKKGVLQCGSFWDQQMRHDIVEALLAGSDGMFLYAALMLNYLKTVPSVGDVYDCLRDLPSGLQKTYELLLVRLLKRLDQHQTTVVSRIFSIVACSGRPMTLEELRLAYALASEPQANLAPLQTKQYLMRLSPEEVIELCGGIVSFKDGLFDMIHNTARAYLTDFEPKQHLGDDSLRGVLHVHHRTAHDLLGIVCVKVFRYAELNEHDPNVETAYWKPLMQYATLYWAHHLNNGSRTKEELLEIFEFISRSRRGGEFVSLEHMFWHEDLSKVFLEHILLIDKFVGVGDQSPDSETAHEVFYSFEKQLQAATDQQDIEDVSPIPLQVEENTTLFGALNVLGSPANASETLENRQYESGLHSQISRVELDGASQAHSRARHSDPTVQRRFRAMRSSVPPELHLHDGFSAIYGAKSKLAILFLRRLRVDWEAFDPLERAWSSMKAAAMSMSPLLASMLTFYLYRTNRYEEAREIGVRCYAKLESQPSIIRTSHELLMGCIEYFCDDPAQSNFYLERALRDLERYPLLCSWNNPPYFRYLLADNYISCTQPSRSFDLLRSMQKNGSYETLQGSNLEGYLYLLGTQERVQQDGVLEDSLVYLSRFRDLVYRRYPDLMQNSQDEWCKWRLVRALQYIADIQYEYGDYDSASNAVKEATTLFQSIGEIAEDDDDDDDERVLNGFQALLDYQLYRQETSDDLLRRAQTECQQPGQTRCENCLVAIEDQFVATKFTISCPRKLRRMSQDFLKILEAYENAHTTTLEGDTLKYKLEGRLANIYYYRYKIYTLNENIETACEHGWRSLEFYAKTCPPIGPEMEGRHEDISVVLDDLADLEIKRGRLELAAICARMASHLLLQFPNPEDHELSESDLRKSIGALLSLSSAPVYESSQTLSERVRRLQMVQTHLCETAIQRMYYVVEGLVDPEMWTYAQTKLFPTQRQLSLEKRSVNRFEKRNVVCSQQILRDYYADCGENQSHGCKHNECCSFRCSIWDDEIIPLSNRDVSPVLLDNIGLIYVPHIPHSHREKRLSREDCYTEAI